jgi:anthranilate phosphoribosyltransferase
LGVNNNDNFEHYRNVYETLDVNFTVINSNDGYDEVSLTDSTRFARKETEGYLAPADFGFEKIQPETIYGGDSIEEAARIFMDILKGKGTQEQNNVVIANAAVGLNLVHPEKSLQECVEMAGESLKSGKALQKLKAVVN